MNRTRLLSRALVGIAVLAALAAAGPTAADDVGAPPDSLTPANSTLTLGAGASATIEKTLHLNAAPPKADVIIAVDTTGSMGPAIADAKADAVAFVNGIKEQIPGARFAVVDFKDYPFSPFGDAGDFAYLRRQALTTNSDSIQSAVNAMTANGGADGPESYNRVIYEAYTDSGLGRDATAPGFLIFLADNLPHDANQSADFPRCADAPPTDPGRDNTVGTADDLPTKKVADGAKANHINVSYIEYNSFGYGPCWAQITAYTGGQQVARSDTASLSTQVVNLIREDAARVDEVTFTVEPTSRASWVEFTPPPTYGPFTAPIDVPFEETITVPSGTPAGTYPITVHAVADGAVRADESISVTVTNQAISSLSLTADQSSRRAGAEAVPFTSIPVSLIPAFAGNTVQSAPGGSIPGGSIPGGSIPGGSIPGGSIPGGSIVFGSLGLGALPGGSIPGGSIPGGSIPGGSIPGGSIGFTRVMQSVLLSQIPLYGTSWDAITAGTPLEGRPLNTLTLYDLALDSTAWGRFKALSWGQVSLATSIWGGVPFAAWLAGNASLAQLPVPGGFSTWQQALDASGGGSTGIGTATNNNTSALSEVTLFGVAVAGQLGRTDIGSISVGSLASLPGGSIPGGSIPALQIPLAGTNGIKINATRLASVPLVDINTTDATRPTLADIVNCGGSFSCSGKTLGEAATAVAVKQAATLGMLLASLPAGHAARQITLSEIVFASLPLSLYPWEQLDPQGAQEYAGNGQVVDYHLDFSVDCAKKSTLQSINIGVPSGEFPVSGVAPTFSVNEGAAVVAPTPRLVKSSPVWTLKWDPFPAGICGDATTGTRDVRLNVSVYERLPIGDHSASATIPTTTSGTYAASNQAPVLVTQNGEPANDDQATAPALSANTLYVGHIGYAGDLDVGTFSLDGLAPGTKVAAYVKVPDGADFDLVLSKPQAAGVRSSPGGSIPGGSIPIENPSAFVDNSGRSLPPETQSDVPQAIPGGSIPGGSIPGGSIPGGSIPGGSISANRGSATEAAQIVTNGESGNAVLTVSGYNGSFSNGPYVLRIQVTPPPPLPACPAVTGLNDAVYQGALPALSSMTQAQKDAVRTIFLVNRQRLVGLYGATDTNELLDSSMTSTLTTISGRSEVGGLVLPVDGDQAVRAAYAAWDQDPCSIPKVNDVVRKINDVVDSYRAQLKNVQYVSILGPDRVVPFWRQYDRGQISPEVDEAAELAFTTNNLTAGNPLYGAAAQNFFLTDGAYGVRTKLEWLGSQLPLPQDSVSRFVETPDEIRGQLQQYLDVNGELDPKSELTTGDDFFTDSADATHQGLLAGFAGISGDTLYPPGDAGWLKQQLLDQFFKKEKPASTGTGTVPDVPDLGALYAHYNPWLAQPAGPTPITSLSELASTADVVGGDELENKLLWSIGCHGGLNIEDTYPNDPADAEKEKDWAQTYGRGRAVWIANTGFGYDDTESVALSGRLMSLFSQLLNRGNGSIGEQWTAAVNTYYLSAGAWDVLDEKVMLQATFYGSPWSHFKTKASAPAYTPPSPQPKDGLQIATLTVTPTITEHTTSDGRSWWDSGGQSLSVPYRSIQPLATRNVTVSGTRAHDAFITSLTVNDLVNKKPVRGNPAIERAAYEREKNFPNIYWPASPVSVLHSGFGDHLNVIAGQFRPNPGSTDLGSERQVTSITVDIAYGSGSDNIRPLVKQTGAVMTGATTATAFAEATDESGPLNKVAVLYNDGVNNFRYKELSRVGTSNLYTGQLTGLARPPEIIGQARDGAGNVGIAANKAVNFTALTDNGKPSIVVDSPLAEAVFTLGQEVHSRYTCSDAGGIASCVGPGPSGALVDTSTVGERTFTVTATDLRGNSTTKVVTYFVHYTFLGFFAPVDNLPALNSVKAGSSVPLKWKLRNVGGAEISTLDAVLSVSSREIKCPTSSALPVEEVAPSTLTPLRYDTATQQYVYTWQTQKTWAGKCRRVFVAFLDGTDAEADFILK